MSRCTSASSRLSLAFSGSSSRRQRASENCLQPDLASLKPPLRQSPLIGKKHLRPPTKRSPCLDLNRNRAASRKVRCLRKYQANIKFRPQQKAHLWAREAFHAALAGNQSGVIDHFEQGRPQQLAHLRAPWVKKPCA